MTQRSWLATFYQQHRRALVAVAWSVVRRADLAEDAVHIAFSKLVKRGGAPRDPKVFVFRCVRNVAIDLLRAKKRRREQTLPEGFDPPASDANQLSESLQLIEEALARLPANVREVIELHLHASLTFQEIADLLGEPLPTVASRYRRGLAKVGEEVRVNHE